VSKDATIDDAASGEPQSWREQAVARSLNPARTRAEKRVQRFLDAALELMNDGDGKDFTVQEVVERSGQSLRSFYQYFGGKHELMLTLFEESIRTTAEQLRKRVADEPDERARLHRFVTEYYRMCRPSPKRKASKEPTPSPVLVEFAQQLLTAHPAEAARVFVPLVALFQEILDEAAAAGVIRPGLDRNRTSGVVLEAIMFHAFATTISGAQSDGVEAGEQLWDLLFHGLAAGS
jgi:AcrR family transcriptional regulator